LHTIILMRRKNTKTVRIFQPDSYVPPLPSKKNLDEHLGFKPGDQVFFNHTLTNDKHSVGLLKEIIEQNNGSIVFFIWDTEKGMWRHIPPERAFHEAPPKRKKGDR